MLCNSCLAEWQRSLGAYTSVGRTVKVEIINVSLTPDVICGLPHSGTLRLDRKKARAVIFSDYPVISDRSIVVCVVCVSIQETHLPGIPQPKLPPQILQAERP